MIYDNKAKELDYKDVFLVPQYSEISSRKQVDTSSTITNSSSELVLPLDVPVFSANMDTCTNANMCISMYKAGGIGALHRFMSIEDNIQEYKKVKNWFAECFVSVGVNEESKERAQSLFNVGARYFVIDIAHGHSRMMKDMLTWMRDTFGSSVIIMAGNVATAIGSYDLTVWGSDLIKVGIGPGLVCLTKNVTGTTRPQFSAVKDCASATHLPIIADGGIQEIGDICKAIGAGASYVMSGRLFAGCSEAPGSKDENGEKIYRGMASTDAMLSIRKDDGSLPTPEGKSIKILQVGSAKDVVKHIKGGLQSAMSYANSSNIKEFQEKAIFGIR